MQNCKGSLELENASSCGGAVSNQVLFTSHIVLKPDVIPIPSTLTCHRGQREIYCCEPNPTRPAGASSEPAAVAAGTDPARSSPPHKYSPDPAKRRSITVTLRQAGRSLSSCCRLQQRRFGVSRVAPRGGRARLPLPPHPQPGRGSRSCATPGGAAAVRGDPGGKDLPLQRGSVPALEMLHPRRGAAGRGPLGWERAAGGP